MKRDFEIYPIYRLNYVRAFDRMLKKREADGKITYDWKTGEAVMRFWVGDDPRQIFLDELDAEYEVL